jgi:UDP-glucose 4-epimerase
MKENGIEVVMHFAARIEVGRSVIAPSEFYRTNLIETGLLLDLLLELGISSFIFSSSCAIYGNPVALPLTESHQRKPLSPYGKTKAAIEWMLEDYSSAYPFKYVALRYFNACGALPEVGIGELHEPETHLIPLAIQALFYERPFTLFGTDYATPDGTAIRDYVHVMDIASAHVKALEHLENTGVSDAFNLGTGHGYSVRQVLSSLERLTRKKVMIKEMPRRAGDAEALVADPHYAEQVLGWKPEYSSIDFIMQSALKWEELRMQLSEKKIILSAA